MKKKSITEAQEREIKILEDYARRHPERPRPITRRDFLSAGLVASAGLLMGPSLLSLLSRDLFAADAFSCPKPGKEGPLLPYFTVDGAGGASVPTVIGGRGGAEDFLPSYNTLGVQNDLRPSLPNAIDTQFGSPFWNGVGSGATGIPAGGLSRVRAGMLSVMSPEACARTRIMTICNISQDDTPNNRISANIMAAAAGLRGSIVPGPIGVTRGPSGGNSDSAYSNPLFTPLYIGSPNAIADSLSFGGTLRQLSTSKKQSMIRSLLRLNGRQRAAFSQRPLGEQFANLSQCAYESNMGFTTAGGSTLASQSDPVIASIFGNNPIHGAVVHSVLKNISGAGALVVPGCDYHGLGFAVKAAVDYQIGLTIGSVVEAAHRMAQQPSVPDGPPPIQGVAISFVTDGGIASATSPGPTGALDPLSDSGFRSSTLLIVYKKDAPPVLNRSQIGHYTSGQVVAVTDETRAFAQNTVGTSHVVFANYLKVSGFTNQQIVDKINELVGSRLYDLNWLQSILGFG